MADGRLFEKRKYTITRPCIVRPNYIYIYTTCHRAGLSASAELLVTCQMPYLLPNQQCQVKTVRLQQQHYKNHSSTENLKVLFIIITQICYSCYLQ